MINAAAAPGGTRDAGNTAPGDWCARLGATESDALMTVRTVVGNYYAMQSMDCATEGLTSSLNYEQFCAWIAYLTSFTYLMAGCVPNFETVTGGTEAFGPANTPYTGAVRSKLTPAEADALTRHYLQAFAMALNLSPEERDRAHIHLRRTAQQEIDPQAPSSLSTCVSLDAGGVP